jgi:hypothetical protein
MITPASSVDVGGVPVIGHPRRPPEFFLDAMAQGISDDGLAIGHEDRSRRTPGGPQPAHYIASVLHDRDGAPESQHGDCKKRGANQGNGGELGPHRIEAGASVENRLGELYEMGRCHALHRSL